MKLTIEQVQAKYRKLIRTTKQRLLVELRVSKPHWTYEQLSEKIGYKVTSIGQYFGNPKNKKIQDYYEELMKAYYSDEINTNINQTLGDKWITELLIDRNPDNDSVRTTAALRMLPKPVEEKKITLLDDKSLVDKMDSLLDVMDIVENTNADNDTEEHKE